MLEIRKATSSDYHSIMAIYEIAREFMRNTGNPNQWKNTNPTPEQVKQDISNQNCHVIYDAAGIHGVFALCEGIDETYLYIEDGAWLNDDEYVTIHRIASDQTVPGIFKCAMDYCKALYKNIRIDTHEDNKVMQHLIEKNGFERCGVIYLKNGEPREAYQYWGRY